MYKSTFAIKNGISCFNFRLRGAQKIMDTSCGMTRKWLEDYFQLSNSFFFIIACLILKIVYKGLMIRAQGHRKVFSHITVFGKKLFNV